MKAYLLVVSVLALQSTALAKCAPDGGPERGARLRVIGPATGGKKPKKNECKVTRLDTGAPVDAVVVKNRKECPAAGMDLVGDLLYRCTGPGTSAHEFTVRDADYYQSHRPEHIKDVQKVVKSMHKSYNSRRDIETQYFRKEKPTGSTRAKTLYCEPVDVIVEVAYKLHTTEEEGDALDGTPKVRQGKCE